MSLSPAPLSLLIKAAPILTEDMYGDILPAAWELLLSVDEHMAAAAGLSGSFIPACLGSPVNVSLISLAFEMCFIISAKTHILAPACETYIS